MPSVGPWIVLVSVTTVVAMAVTAVVMARRRFIVATVSGESMTPTLRPGDRVLVRRASGTRIAAGTVVLLRQPTDACPVLSDLPDRQRGLADHQWVIKRVAATRGDPVPEPVRAAVADAAVVPQGMLVVLGDNATSADSRTWGFCSVGSVLGAVVRQLPREQA